MRSGGLSPRSRRGGVVRQGQGAYVSNHSCGAVPRGREVERRAAELIRLRERREQPTRRGGSGGAELGRRLGEGQVDEGIEQPRLWWVSR